MVITHRYILKTPRRETGLKGSNLIDTECIGVNSGLSARVTLKEQLASVSTVNPLHSKSTYRLLSQQSLSLANLSVIAPRY